MILVLLVSFFVRRPYMPVNPNTISGCMYYLCDSVLLNDLAGLADMNDRERVCHLKQINGKCRFGLMDGVNAKKKRVGIDYR